MPDLIPSDLLSKLSVTDSAAADADAAWTTASTGWTSVVCVECSAIKTTRLSANVVNFHPATLTDASAPSCIACSADKASALEAISDLVESNTPKAGLGGLFPEVPESSATLNAG